MSKKENIFAVPDSDIPRAKAEPMRKLANGTRVLARLKVEDEWEPGVITGQGYNNGKLVLGYEVKFEKSQMTHTIAFPLLGSHIKPEFE